MGFIKNLQAKPYEVRQKILIVSTILAAILIVSIWIFGIKNEFKNQNIQGSSTQNSQISANHYIRIESADEKNGRLLIYFAVNNDTSDILNFSKLNNINLVSDGETHTPTQILDRQNQNFVQKILSKNQNFGILAFEVSKINTADLHFDNLYFENSPQNIFKEQLSINFNDLPKMKDLRN